MHLSLSLFLRSSHWKLSSFRLTSQHHLCRRCCFCINISLLSFNLCVNLLRVNRLNVADVSRALSSVSRWRERATISSVDECRGHLTTWASTVSFSCFFFIFSLVNCKFILTHTLHEMCDVIDYGNLRERKRDKFSSHLTHTQTHEEYACQT